LKRERLSAEQGKGKVQTQKKYKLSTLLAGLFRFFGVGGRFPHASGFGSQILKEGTGDRRGN